MGKLGNKGASKLTEEKAEIIKKLLNTGDYTHKQIADFFNVSRVMITLINTGYRWNEDRRKYVLKSIVEPPTTNDCYNDDINPYGDKDKSIKSIKITYKNGTEMELR